MTDNFHLFSTAVHARFEYLQTLGGELFVVDTLDLFDAYLAAFPEGTNPIFRERTEHDCSCCKAFIRNIGNVVAISDGAVVTVWDVDNLPAPYDVVAKALADRIRQAPIKSVWRTKERQYGNEFTNELLTLPEGVVTRRWDHFWGKTPTKQFSLSPDKARGDINTRVHVLQRGLQELSIDALDTVIDLAEAGNLYKGDEFLPAIKGFRALKAAYDATDDKNLMVWSNLADPSARFRNMAIGTLIQELSEGKELEWAVKSYETKVAPTNYKRPTALVTPKMIEAGLAKLDELGLRDAATNRRHARIEDVSVNDVLFVDNSVAAKMKDSLADALMSSAKVPTAKIEHATPISAEEFFATIVPKAKAISALVEGRHASNFASITAGDPGLFLWDNGFSWSYDGDVADNIKQRVKLAGGNIDAKFRVSLAWFNTDDLDLHCYTPNRGHIYYGSKAGILDVDANGPGERSRTDPVENMAFSSVANGVYVFDVNQYSRLNSSEVGFELEVEMDGQVQRYSYTSMVTGTIRALEITIQNGKIADFKLGAGLVGGAFSTEKWGIRTETLVPVDTLMLSPNHWGERPTGNKHWFFILRDAKNPDPVRGIYNEYLKPEMNEHRKVFELLGAKTKAPFSDAQLSGLGFSSTQRNTLKVVADGRAFEIQF